MAKKEVKNPFLNPSTPTTLPFAPTPILTPNLPASVGAIGSALGNDKKFGGSGGFGGGGAEVGPKGKSQTKTQSILNEPMPNANEGVYTDPKTGEKSLVAVPDISNTPFGRAMNKAYSPDPNEELFRQNQLMAKQKEQQFQKNLNKQTIEEQFNQQTANISSFDLRQSAPSIVSGIVSPVAQIIDKAGNFLPSWLQLGTAKSVEVKKAEATFADMTAVIDKDLALYQAGLKSRSEIDRDMSLAQDSIIDLYRETKGKGQIDVRFWLDKGKEIETQILKELAILENQRRLLDAYGA